MKEVKEREALIEHECDVCGQIIYAGERYMFESYRDENNKIHRVCKHIACSKEEKVNA